MKLSAEKRKIVVRGKTLEEVRYRGAVLTAGEAEA
jgi:hypothetical protein